jgi:hypothetical protein
MLAEMRLIQEQENREARKKQAAERAKKKSQQDEPVSDNNSAPGASPSAPIAAPLAAPLLAGQALWFFYIELMNTLREAAAAAQNEFLIQLRTLLLTKVRGSDLEKILISALAPQQPSTGATVLLRYPIREGIPGVLGVTKGGYLIFSSIVTPDPGVVELINRLSTAPKW